MVHVGSVDAKPEHRGGEAADQRIERLLDAEEQRLGRAIDELRSIALDEGPDEHDSGEPAWTSEDAAGAASDTLTREVGYGLIEDFRTALEDVLHARHRLRSDQYGRCERCGAAIDPMRLEAVPATRWCLSCAREVERDVRSGLLREPVRHNA